MAFGKVKLRALLATVLLRPNLCAGGFATPQEIIEFLPYLIPRMCKVNEKMLTFAQF